MRKMTSNVTKRLLSMALVMVMTLAMALSVSTQSNAAGKSTNAGTVRVYVTQGMFTIGGFDTTTNKPIPQTYISSKNPAANANKQLTNYEVYDLEIETVEGLLSETRAVYEAPDSLSMDPNVLDAIIVALQFCGYEPQGGWDYHPVDGEPGGYIHAVPPVNPTFQDTVTETINGVTYNVYRGFGWNIACTQNGSVKAIDSYGSNYGLSDGMVIVFDFSQYRIYDTN